MNSKRTIIILAVVLLIGMLFATAALAQEGTLLSWWTADSGGRLSESGYTLISIIGQPEAAEPMSTGGYTLRGGFLSHAHAGSAQIYLPVIQR